MSSFASVDRIHLLIGLETFSPSAYHLVVPNGDMTMVLGMSLATYTLIHVIISLFGIGSGLLVIFALLNGKRLGAMTSIFLVTTALTSLTGFGFPFTHLLPSHILGILSLVDLAIAIPALYVFHLSGAWRKTYVITAAIALYFNCFVLLVQGFEKVPALHVLAPTQKEPPFAVAQLLLLVAFVVLTTLAVKGFRAIPGRAVAG